MKTISKYQNLKDRFPCLQDVLCNSIQNEFLEIKKIKNLCGAYGAACDCHPELKNASCVIYSPYIDKRDHDYETFIFIDDKGKLVKHISGHDMALYGMLEPVNGLIINRRKGVRAS